MAESWCGQDDLGSFGLARPNGKLRIDTNVDPLYEQPEWLMWLAIHIAVLIAGYSLVTKAHADR
jgi:hypothetical protein